jgi:hypothetical protein
MSNIVGEGFDPVIISQVNKRQEMYGSINRTPEQLQYLNANTGWVRLASSVDIAQGADIRNIPDYLRSNNLAKQYVLFGGIQGVKGTNFNNIHSNALNTEAYGIGGTEFGIKPMPGIKSAQIKTLTRGSLKEATIQIIANNRTQFDIIDILYLRLGFTMLLEWGHASYFPNIGDFVENNPFSIYTGFLEGFYLYNDILDIIQDSRLKSNGNYDAIAGKVVNFNWKYNRNGSYTINLILRSLGDVIESLKSNILLGSGESENEIPLLLQKPPENSQNANDFVGINEIVSGNQSQTQVPLKATNPIAEEKVANEIEKYFKNLKLSLTENPNDYNIVKKKNNNNYYKQIFKDANGSADSEIYYIRLGEFLGYIQQNLIPVTNNNTPLFKFDLSVDRNLIYIANNQISSDPRICTFQKNVQIKSSSNPAQFAPGMEPFESSKGSNAGQILNAYFGMDWIAQTIRNELTTSTGEVSILNLVKALCNGWNRATGYINKLGVQLDETTNRAYIYDETSIPGRETIIANLGLSDKTAKFLAFRTETENGINKSGFIKDIDFTTQIPANFSTLITVGSTANGYVLGADATALSRMNAGLTDRVKPTISSPRSKKAESIEQKYSGAIAAFNSFLEALSYINRGSGQYHDTPHWNEEQVNTFVKLQPQFLEYEQYLATKAGLSKNKGSSSPNIGFLPFNMSLTMDGLSGMKVYQKFELDTNFLPSNYPDSLEFIIKGITHNIQNNEWVTNIESIAIPKNPFGTTVNRTTKKSSTQNNSKDCSNNVPIPPGNLLSRAQADLTRWDKRKETAPGVYCYLKEYWDSIGINSWDPAITSWSSAYVAWLTRGSGFEIDNKFNTSDNKFTKIANDSLQNHNNYIQAAVSNTKNKNLITTGNFIPHYEAIKIGTIPIKEGDILIYNQPGNSATFDSLYGGKWEQIHGDVVISVDINNKTITTQGGNLSETVRKYTIKTPLTINSAPYPNGPKYIMHLQYISTF